MILKILSSSVLASIAAIGFSTISHSPKQSYGCCALIAAIGYTLRYVLMNNPFCQFHIILASGIASFCIGTLAVFIAPHIKCPAEVCSSPALLPMIPGIYLYRTIKALFLCLYHQEETIYLHYFYLFSYNGFTSISIITAMVMGITIPIFIFKKISFQATR